MSDQSTPQSNTNPASPGDSLSLDATSPFLECNVESDISAPPENTPLLSWASQVSLASKDEQISNSQTYQSTSTYQLSDHDSSDMDTQTCIFVCPSKVKNLFQPQTLLQLLLQLLLLLQNTLIKWVRL